MYFRTYPYDAQNEKAFKSNPAIQLFGNRLFSDQVPVELLIELLLVVSSSKRVDESDVFLTALPSIGILSENYRLQYSPKARLNLKLFSFLGASRIESRHLIHREQHKFLINELYSKIFSDEVADKEEVIKTIENLFLGFQGAGIGRTWCAQGFLPVCPGFLAGETIWNETFARNNPPESWDSAIDSMTNYFTMNRHRFLARGGELLYLQICNALGQQLENVQKWSDKNNIGLNSSVDNNEQNPAWLHAELEKELTALMQKAPKTISNIAEFIDTALDKQTAEKTDRPKDTPRYVSAGWCAVESWQEGYLLAVDLLRICKTNLDLIDRIYLLETACAMHVLRSLAMQSARYSPDVVMDWPGYRIVVSSPDGESSVVKKVSQQSVRVMEKLIFKAIRNTAKGVILPEGDKQPEKALKEADKSYAGKLFLGLGKRIGLIVPKRGAGARFVLNEQLMRLLVLTIVPPGKRITYDTFKQVIEKRHGLVFDPDGINRASSWLFARGGVYLPHDTDAWFQDMLEAAGFLIRLSDSCALVENPSVSIN